VCNDDKYFLAGCFERMKVREVRYKNVYTVHSLVRERHSHIDDDGSGLCFKYRHVPADLTESAKRGKANLPFGSDVDLLPWIHGRFFDACILFYGSSHRIVHSGDILLASSASALAAVSVLIVT